jgi:hypothetical protein
MAVCTYAAGIDMTQDESQKPVGWIKVSDTEWSISFFEEDGYVPLYTHPPQRTEQNFCSRCGKRTKDLTTIHTCTPPQD